MLGGSFNTKTSIRSCQGCSPEAQDISGPYLAENEFLPFWISWARGYIKVGRNEVVLQDVLVEWFHTDPYEVNYIALSSWNGNNASWILETGLYFSYVIKNLTF